MSYERYYCTGRCTKAIYEAIRGMKNLTYNQRLTKLNLESLEVRRSIRADLIFAYKLIFGLTGINPSEFFTVRVSDTRYTMRTST